MPNISRSLRRLAFPENKKSSHLTKAFVMLALVFVVSGVGGATSVQAAPTADTTTITHLELQQETPLPSPTCAHTHYKLSFRVLASAVTNLGGDTVHLDGGIYPSAISITGESSSSDIAEVNTKAITASAESNWTAPMDYFDIQTHDVLGSATLTFQATVVWAGQKYTIGPLPVPITVVHCRYKIVLMSIVSGGFPGTVETVAYRVTGEIGGDADGTLQGEGQVTWTPKQSTECFESVQTVMSSKATIHGSPSQDGKTLTINVAYDQGMLFGSGHLMCGATGASSATLPFQAPSVQFEVPATGGAQSRSTSLQIGDAGMTGTATILVVPVKNE